MDNIIHHNSRFTSGRFITAVVIFGFDCNFCSYSCTTCISHCRPSHRMKSLTSSTKIALGCCRTNLSTSATFAIQQQHKRSFTPVQPHSSPRSHLQIRPVSSTSSSNATSPSPSSSKSSPSAGTSTRRSTSAATSAGGPQDPLAYCSSLVRRLDPEAYLTSYFWGRRERAWFLAWRAFNVSAGRMTACRRAGIFHLDTCLGAVMRFREIGLLPGLGDHQSARRCLPFSKLSTTSDSNQPSS